MAQGEDAYAGLGGDVWNGRWHSLSDASPKRMRLIGGERQRGYDYAHFSLICELRKPSSAIR